MISSIAVIVGVAIIGALAVLFALRSWLEKRFARVVEGRFRLQLIMLSLSVAALIVIVMVLPITDSARGQLLSLFGILLSAAIALSATTFLGNIMAGGMLRVDRAYWYAWSRSHPGSRVLAE